MKLLVTLFLALNSTLVLAFPKAPFNALASKVNFTPDPLMSDDYNFEGIVKLSNCSASLVKFEGTSDERKAIVMTNGHCFPDMVAPGRFVYNEAGSRRMQLFKTLKKSFTVKSQKVLYATMTGTDVTLYELTESYKDLFTKYGVQALTMSQTKATVHDKIEVISGYWEKGYRCNIDGFVGTLLEDAWTFEDSIRYTPECNTIGGTSGSPIVASGTRTVVGINNTGSDNGELCTMNNPCEVDTEGRRTAHQGTSYGQQTYQIYSCLNALGDIDLSLEGCLLHH